MRPQRMEVDIIQAERTDADQMASLWVEAFEAENSKFTQLMYAGVDLLAQPMLKDILRKQVTTEGNKFVICYNLDLGTRFEEDWHPEEEEENITYGWISVGIVSDASPDFHSYAVHDFSVYVCWMLLLREARALGDSRHRSIDNPRFRLVAELTNRSTDGQARNFDGAHLVVNALVLYPEGHEDETWELAFKLLGWATAYAERRNLPLWTQIPVNQMGFFRQAGFRDVRAFTLNLNDYKPRESRDDWGTQEWVQMVYRAPEERRARSISPRGRGERRRRLSF